MRAKLGLQIPVKAAAELLQHGLDRGHVIDQRQHGARQAVDIPVHHLWLRCKGVAALMIGVIADVPGIKGLEKAEWPVIECHAEDAHIVGVEYAVTKADGLPVCHQFSAALHHDAQQCQVGLVSTLQLWIAGFNHVVSQLAQMFHVALASPVFERAKAHERGRHACHHRCGLEAFADHRQGRSDQRQGACGRHTKRGHRF
jgi:hypothetical protein